MRAGVALCGLVSPVLFSLHVNGIPTPSGHVELEQYADDTSSMTMSRSPHLLVGYPQAYRGRLELWIRDSKIAISVSKITDVLFAKAVRGDRESTQV
jgi:hypothetical protein